MVVAYLSLGSNLGERAQNLNRAIQQIGEHPQIKIIKVSSNYETEPWGHTDQPKFINAAAAIETDLPARELLNYLKNIEKALGRTETFKWGPRIIDLDILTYGDQTINEPDLIIPHPRMQDREFVLRPLNEIIAPMTEPLKITCTSKEETDSLAMLVAGVLYPGLVIALIGDLGAGKTTFTQSLIKHSGNNEIVTSPTFTLLNIYPGKTKFYHFDLYRLGSLLDIENIGGEELIPSKDGVTLIEWADRIPEIMPESYLKIAIDYVDENSRAFNFTSIGKTVEIERIKQQWQF